MPNIAAPAPRGQIATDYMQTAKKYAGASVALRVAGYLAQSLIQDPSLKSGMSSAIYLGSLLTTAAAMDNVKEASLASPTSFVSTTDRFLQITASVASAALAHINGGATAGEVIAPEVKPIIKLGMDLYGIATAAQIANGFNTRRHETDGAQQAAPRA